MIDWWFLSSKLATAAKFTSVEIPHENPAGRPFTSAIRPLTSDLEFSCYRLLRVRVIIKPFARLSPVPPRHHHPLQQRRRREPALLELVVHHVRDVVGRVEADEIEQ